MHVRSAAVLLFPLLLAPSLAHSAGWISSITPLNSGCVSGPNPTNNNNVRAWDMQPGKTYKVTLKDVTNCANGGTNASIGIYVKHSILGNTFLTASLVSTGTYTFNYTVPANGCETFPVRYCATQGSPNSGFAAGFQAGTGTTVHLRASTFQAGCTFPVEISCTTTPVEPATWGSMKSIYR